LIFVKNGSFWFSLQPTRSLLRGELPRKCVRRATHELQDWLRNLCMAWKEGQKSVVDAFRGIGHAIRFA